MSYSSSRSSLSSRSTCKSLRRRPEARQLIARGPNEALAQLHQFMVSAAVIDPRQLALISELQLRQIRVVLKAGTTGEVLARLARSVSNGTDLSGRFSRTLWR